MASKYSDIVRLRETRPAYNIQEEKEGAWKSFIANEQFNEILRGVLRSVRNNDASAHRSFWISGTYGSGKSHAAAVIQHLLSDDVMAVREYVYQEFGEEKYRVMKDDILNLREKKRLLPVNLYGQQNISQASDLSLQIQTMVKIAMKKAGIDMAVKTDFDNYVAKIDENQELFELMIKSDGALRSVAPDVKKLRTELADGNMEILGKVKDAERAQGIVIRLDLANLKQWLIDVQNRLKEGGVYDGLLIVWDEFTEPMRSAVCRSILVPIQEIVEAFSSSENDSYFFFITHPSAFDQLGEEAKKTQGRFLYYRYNMEVVSAFKIMSRKFVAVNQGSSEYENLCNDFYKDKGGLLEKYATDSTKPDETREDLKKVFPLHPGTANLATYYAREVGSSSRSVFDFIASERVRDFLESEEKFSQRATITADMLWDYVKGDFDDKNEKYGAVTERYNSYKADVEKEGEAEFAVFKSILLLNALNNIAQNETVVPNERNISALFEGTPYMQRVQGVLTYLDEKGIIQRNPMGQFSIQFSALPSDELKKEKDQLKLNTFRYTYLIARHGDCARSILDTGLKMVSRPMAYELFSIGLHEAHTLKEIEDDAKKAKPYETYIAMLLAKDNVEFEKLRAIAEKASGEERFQNVAFIVFHTTLGEQDYEKFLDYAARSRCAQNHTLDNQAIAYGKDANKIVSNWIEKVRRGLFDYYLRGEKGVQNANQMASTINESVAPIIFSNGPESLPLIQQNNSQTYWKKKVAKAGVDAVLLYDSKSEVLSKRPADGKHLDLLMQDSVGEDMGLKADADSKHPLVIVCQKIKGIIDRQNKNEAFNLGDKLRKLSEPPYGLYQSFAGMGMVAYALRQYAKHLFDTNGKPREAQHLAGDVVEMFKAWEEGKSSPKLNVQLESRESGKLCRQLIDIFALDRMKEYSSVSSLTDARWGIFAFCKEKGYPLWALKYAKFEEKEEQKERLDELIDNVLKICEPDGKKNPSLITDTMNGLENNSFEMKHRVMSNEYKMGFYAFMMRNEDVNMQEGEEEEAYNFLRRSMQGEIGSWKESDVSNTLLKWRIQRIQKEKEEREATPVIPKVEPNSYVGNGATQDGSAQCVAETVGSVSESSWESVARTREKIERLNADDAKMILSALCERYGMPDILNEYIDKVISRSGDGI